VRWACLGGVGEGTGGFRNAHPVFPPVTALGQTERAFSLGGSASTTSPLSTALGSGGRSPPGCRDLRPLAGAEVCVPRAEHQPKAAPLCKPSPAAGGSASLIYSSFLGPQVWTESVCSLLEKVFSPLQRNTQHLHKFQWCPEGSRIRGTALTTNPSVSSGNNQFLCAVAVGIIVDLVKSKIEGTFGTVPAFIWLIFLFLSPPPPQFWKVTACFAGSLPTASSYFAEGRAAQALDAAGLRLLPGKAPRQGSGQRLRGTAGAGEHAARSRCSQPEASHVLTARTSSLTATLLPPLTQRLHVPRSSWAVLLWRVK